MKFTLVTLAAVLLAGNTASAFFSGSGNAAIQQRDTGVGAAEHHHHSHSEAKGHHSKREEEDDEDEVCELSPVLDYWISREVYTRELELIKQDDEDDDDEEDDEDDDDDEEEHLVARANPHYKACLESCKKAAVSLSLFPKRWEYECWFFNLQNKLGSDCMKRGIKDKDQKAMVAKCSAEAARIDKNCQAQCPK